MCLSNFEKIESDTFQHIMAKGTCLVCLFQRASAYTVAHILNKPN